MMHSASTTDIPNFFLYSSTESPRSEEHTSELQSQSNIVCRLLLEKKKTNTNRKLTRRILYSASSITSPSISSDSCDTGLTSRHVIMYTTKSLIPHTFDNCAATRVV